MRLLLIIISTLSFHFMTAQNLDPARVKRIKDATVRITIDSTTSVGTGFFIAEQGVLLSCWHVIKPAITTTAIHKIYIELNTGEQLEAFLPNFPPDFIKRCIVYDFAYLTVNNAENRKFSFLKIGKYEDLQEGESVYTCGYPLGIKQQFISQGIASTKYQDTITYTQNNIPIDKHNREQALLDLTLNRGNSGGAVLRLGSNPEDDSVIGIADFIIIPFGQAVESLYEVTHNPSSDIEINGISTMGVYQLFSGALAQASNGISGCVSIEHFLQAFSSLHAQKK